MREVLFVWIPKTAGTSIFKACADKYNMQGIFGYNMPYADFQNTGSVTFGHASPQSLLKTKIISEEYWRKAYKFTVVRNPYTQAVSLWQDFTRTNRLRAGCSFQEFLSIVFVKEPLPGLFNVQDFSQCAPQFRWVLPGIDIIKYEELQADLWGKLEIAVPYLNGGNYGNYENFYDNDCLELVNTIYYNDFLLFNYPMAKVI